MSRVLEFLERKLGLKPFGLFVIAVLLVLVFYGGWLASKKHYESKGWLLPGTEDERWKYMKKHKICED